MKRDAIFMLITTCALCATAHAQMVARWTMDAANVIPSFPNAEIRDNSGFNNHADLKNRTASTVPGRVGQAIQFDGVDDYANRDSFSGLPSNAITVSALVMLGAQKNWNRIVNHEWVNNGWLLFADSSGSAIFGIGVAGVQYTTYKAGLNVGAWHHVVGVYDGQYVRVYVDCVEGVSRHISGVVLDRSGSVDIAGKQRDRFNGLIDDVRIYNRALSLDEIKALYN